MFHVKAVILFCVLANPTELKSVESELILSVISGREAPLRLEGTDPG